MDGIARKMRGPRGKLAALLAGFLLVSALLGGCSAPISAAGGSPSLPTAELLAERTPPGALSTLPAGEPTPAEPHPAARVTPGEPGPAASATPEGAALPTSAPTLDPALWQEWPVIPALSPRAVDVLRAGLEQGRSPRAFSKIGDCESQADWFLGDFDLGPKYYTLGQYEAELSPVVANYQGSFGRTSLAARPGFTAASLLSPIWADRQQCEKGETPLACEFRVHQPLVAFILIGTNDASNPKTFEGHMRRVIEYSLEQGVLPVLGTKADNVEGDHRINATIARLSAEYGLPMWNYWAAVQSLPGGGLQEDGVHLTFAAPHFDDPEAMRRAWPIRNLNALLILREVLDAAPGQ